MHLAVTRVYDTLLFGVYDTVLWSKQFRCCYVFLSVLGYLWADSTRFQGEGGWCWILGKVKSSRTPSQVAKVV